MGTCLKLSCSSGTVVVRWEGKCTCRFGDCMSQERGSDAER